MAYSVLLADADGTLFDFAAGEKVAISTTFAAFHIPDTEENVSLYHRVNDAQWKKLERGETTQEKLRVDRFRDFLALTGYTADVHQLAAFFPAELGKQRILIDGAETFCREVSRHMPIYLVTNGISSVQRSRFTDCVLTPYLSGLIISEEIGYAKPHPAMLHAAMSAAGISDPRQAVMLGDSITADIAAANNAGVDSILFTNGKTAPEGHPATYTATTLEDAKAIILGA
ncbi:MAG: noncanonical pyrimidine nucleotidase, YjjG family [Clostridiales bacterium]|nr:noncanonical pyrimidine nucleotidase, YjjG family [Clostridiales bacterium]